MKNIVRALVVLFALLAVGVVGADTTTTNYGFVKPSSGSAGWDAKINTNFDTIDTTIYDATGRGCVVERSTDQTAIALNDKILFNAELYDTDSIHDTTTNTSRLTVPSGVTKVKLSAAIYGSGVTGYEVYKNGVLLTSGGMGVTVNSILPNGVTSAVLVVTAGDYFELNADTGSSGTVCGTTCAGRSWFGMEIIK